MLQIKRVPTKAVKQAPAKRAPKEKAEKTSSSGRPNPYSITVLTCVVGDDAPLGEGLPSAREINAAIDEILPTLDLKTATARQVRKSLEQKLGKNLQAVKKQINQMIIAKS